MANFIKSNKELISKCYLVILVVSALLFQTVVYRCTYDFEGDEWILLWKMTPWTLVPMLASTLLAAYYTDKGYGKTVGIIGLFLLLGSAVIMSGSMLWASMSYRETKVIWTHLSGYPVRAFLAVFLIANSFMRGGAIAILLSMLSDVRKSAKRAVTIRVMIISAIVTCILVLLNLIIRFQLTWPLIALGGSIIVVMAIPAIFCLKSMECEPEDEVLVSCEKDKGWIMPTAIFALCILTFISYWQYVPNSWRYYHIGTKTLHYMSMIISMATFAICLWIPQKRARKNGILIGAILLLLGLPLGAMMMDEGFLFDIIPMVFIGIGMAMIIKPTVEAFITLPVKMYSLTWVGIITVVILICKLVLIMFNRMEVALHTRSVAEYIIYPLVTIALIIMGYQSVSQDKNQSIS